MSIYRRGNKWYAYIVSDGRRIRRSAGSREEARELESELRRRAKTPQRGLEEALANHLTATAQHLKAYKTVISVARHIRPFLAGMTIEDSPKVAQRMVNEWTGKLKPATINRRLALLRRLCNLAFEWGWTDVQGGRRIKLLPGEVSRQFYLTPYQIETLAKEMPTSGDFIRVLFATGLRKSELFKLRPEQVKDGCILLASDTKTGKPRIVPIPAFALPLVQLPWMFTEHVLRTEFERARALVGLTHIRIHDIRHSYASQLVMAGIPLRTVGELLGHTTPAMTQRYAHLSPAALTEAVARAFQPQSAPQDKGERHS